jgi:hypothetical protein
VLLDGEGLGHIPSTSASAKVQHVMASAENVPAAIGAAKLILVFTHFDEIKGHNLPTPNVFPTLPARASRQPERPASAGQHPRGELIAKLRDLKVQTPMILLISQPNRAVSARAAKAEVPIVEKPLLGNTLVDKIREACTKS